MKSFLLKVKRFLEKINNEEPNTTVKKFQGEAFELETEFLFENKGINPQAPKELFPIYDSLSNDQREYMDAIRWLIYGPRGSGRTYALALGYIEASLYLRQWVSVRGHGAESRRHVLQAVEQICNKCKGLSLKVTNPLREPSIKVSIELSIFEKIHKGKEYEGSWKV